MNAYRAFDPADAARASPIGWDAWAEEYARLPDENVAYGFSKRLLYDLVDSEIGARRGLDILDFNCGCGNDFAHLLENGGRVVGCDGSPGMLAVAARNHAKALESGMLALFLGRAESLSGASFGDRRFDLILSATGGTAYLDERHLRELHRVFGSLLKPGGAMIVTHLLPRCLVETLWHLAHARPRAAARRWRERLSVVVKGETMTMYLRSVSDLRRSLGDIAPPHRLVPLNVITPAFQTGIRLWSWAVAPLYRGERLLQALPPSLAVSDQVAWISRKVA